MTHYFSLSWERTLTNLHTLGSNAKKKEILLNEKESAYRKKFDFLKF